MITKRELLDLASKLGLRPDVVEKDYALGWALAGIYANETLSKNWVFKGGTCLKKCFFETYRFSEDLDFTLRDEAHLDEALLKSAFNEISEWVYEASGLEMPIELQSFDIYENPRGKLSCQGKIGYRGPISPPKPPNIKLDLTADERLVLAPAKVAIFHPYSDAPEQGIEVLAYAYQEAFGEKVRALAERTRPRDLYDVINLFRNSEARPSPSVLLDVLKQKCDFKGIGLPKLSDLEIFKSDLEGSWKNMLSHQLPALPPVEAFWEALSEFFEWLEGGHEPVIPAAFSLSAGDTIIRERTLRLPVSGKAQSYIEIIRFAAANRLCVELDYQGSRRLIEPYSLRRTSTGNILLHAWNSEKNAHRSYRVDRIGGVRTTNISFTPRYEVELMPEGPVIVPPTPVRTTVSPPGRHVSTRRRSTQTGPIYVYECTYCEKHFRRKKRNSRLNPHKDKDGYPCSGRSGYLIDTKY